MHGAKVPGRTGGATRTSIFATTPLPVGLEHLQQQHAAQQQQALQQMDPLLRPPPPSAASFLCGLPGGLLPPGSGGYSSYPQSSGDGLSGTPFTAGGFSASDMTSNQTVNILHIPDRGDCSGSDSDSEANFSGRDYDGATGQVLDARKRKRMLANRESARRSRRRKQEHLDQLEVVVTDLRTANAKLQKQVTALKQQVTATSDERATLQRQVFVLQAKLRDCTTFHFSPRGPPEPASTPASEGSAPSSITFQDSAVSIMPFKPPTPSMSIPATLPVQTTEFELDGAFADDEEICEAIETPTSELTTTLQAL
eukprot:jgi/Chlat1/7268/Chrsp58S06906